MLQRSKKPIVLAVNKMDSTGTIDPDFYEFYNLGLGDPIAVSAIHGLGVERCWTSVFSTSRRRRKRMRRMTSSRWP